MWQKVNFWSWKRSHLPSQPRVSHVTVARLSVPLNLRCTVMIKLTSKGSCKDFTSGKHSAWHLVNAHTAEAACSHLPASAKAAQTFKELHPPDQHLESRPCLSHCTRTLMAADGLCALNFLSCPVAPSDRAGTYLQEGEMDVVEEGLQHHGEVLPRVIAA